MNLEGDIIQPITISVYFSSPPINVIVSSMEDIFALVLLHPLKMHCSWSLPFRPHFLLSSIVDKLSDRLETAI